MRLSQVFLVAAVLSVFPGYLNAQISGAPERSSGPTWTGTWSPLRPVADLPRVFPGFSLDPTAGLVDSPPGVGLFWTGGNPAGIAREIVDEFSFLEIGSFREIGDYRPPLQPGEETSYRGTAFGWSRLGRSGGGIGRVVVDRSAVDGPAFSQVVSPYSSNPLVVFDTVGAPRTRTAARIEGGGGWALGRLSLGMSAGVEVRKMSTDGAPAPVSTRTAFPAASVGISWQIRRETLGIGTHARWGGSRHSLSQFSLVAPSRIYEFAGFDTPAMYNLVGTVLRRRIEGDGGAVGVQLEGRVAGMRFAVSGEVLDEEAVRFDGSAATSRKDRWQADGWSVSAAADGTLFRTALHMTLTGKNVEGALRLPETPGPTFRTEEARWSFLFDLHRSWEIWHLGFSGGLIRDSQKARDAAVGVGSELRTWIPAGLIEAGGDLGAGWSGSLGLGVSGYVPNGTLPTPGALGTPYQEWIAPGLSYFGSKSVTTTVTATFRRQLTQGSFLFFAGDFSRISPSDRTFPLPDTPGGNRTVLSVRIGICRS